MIRQILIKNIFPIFFPKICLHCKNRLTDTDLICHSCHQSVPFIALPSDNFHPAELRLQHRFPYNLGYASLLMSKHGVISKLLHELKYKSNRAAGSYLGELMAADMEKNFPFIEIDAILPVPLHRNKEKIRGFNQSFLISQIVGEKLNIPIITNAVIRNKNTPSQTRKSRIERLKNLQSTFSVVSREALCGKHILIIDDVLTTGATLESVAMEILKIEGTKVSVATLALASDF